MGQCVGKGIFHNFPDRLFHLGTAQIGISIILVKEGCKLL
jgi:hypothetical protein